VSDTVLAQSCIEGCNAAGIRARGVDYDQFPIDTGTITAASLMNFGTDQLPVVMAANNLYHNAAQTESLGASRWRPRRASGWPWSASAAYRTTCSAKPST
jgi:2-aminophenol/2-amino-5-chlorophenol 1,6-dioxygenase alpha subunit